MHRRRSAGLLWVSLVLAQPLAGQAVTRGFELERLGRHPEAAALYRAVLQTDPSNEAALLGLERVLPRLDRTEELLAVARRARVADPDAATPRGVELRALAELDARDALDSAGAAWIAAQPLAVQPYRELALALADHGRLDAARDVLRAGRQHVDHPEALATLAAELEQRAGDWVAAAQHWRAVITELPAQRANATYHLAEAPMNQRDGVLAALATQGAPPVARRLAADLLLTWDQPEAAWRVMAGALDGPTAEVARALWEFAQRAEAIPGPAARRARGYALAAYADRAPLPVAVRVRAEAARALLAGEDVAGARAQLAQLANTPDAPPEARALAEIALIDLLIRDGALDEARGRLDTATASGVATDEARLLRRDLAHAYLKRGELAAAESALGSDSSVTAAATRGWIALYRGELAAAESLFRRAGPYAGDRADATARTAMLALLQTIATDESSALGAALLLLERGDSTAAVKGLREAAAQLAPASRSGVLVLAGRIAARPGGDADLALRLFAEAGQDDATAAFAPEADLLAARVLLRAGRTAEAIARLEHLILLHPASAFAPEARRELERARGVVPRS